jgi:ATP-dependent Clp protease protease subunit
MKEEKMKNFLIALCLIFSGQAFAGEAVTLTLDNTIAINDEFDGHSVSQIAKKARELDARIPSGDPIYLVINSPGGSIEDGLELIENLSNLRRPIITISLFSASMGFQTVQALGERYVTKMGTLMSHRATGGFYGQMPGSLGTRYAFYLRRVLKLDENAVRRSKGKLTTASYATLIQDEFWCDGQDCIDKGLADKIVSPSCDKSLTGFTSVSVFQALMGAVVEIFADYDNCPLNTNVLKYTLLVNGQPLFTDGASIQSLSRILGEKDQREKEKKEKESAGLFSSSYWSSSSSYDSPKSPIDSLTKDQITEIWNKYQEVKKKKENRDVIKGY